MRANNILDFTPMNSRIFVLTLETHKQRLSFISCHAPTEESSDNIKDLLYDELEPVVDMVRSDQYKVLIEDLNAKIGKEAIFCGTIEKHSLYNISNHSGTRFINFDTAKGMFICRTDCQ